jgi:hypothetical protein
MAFRWVEIDRFGLSLFVEPRKQALRHFAIASIYLISLSKTSFTDATNIFASVYYMLEVRKNDE